MKYECRRAYDLREWFESTGTMPIGTSLWAEEHDYVFKLSAFGLDFLPRRAPSHLPDTIHNSLHILRSLYDITDQHPFGIARKR
jgi:hypothetical protein